MTHKIIKTDNYLLVVDDSEIRVGDILYDNDLKIVLLWQNYLPKHQLISKQKIIAHLPLNNATILEGVDLLPPLEDDLEQLAELKYPITMSPIGRNLAGGYYDVDLNYSERCAYKVGYNKAREKYKYTDEDMRKAIEFGLNGLNHSIKECQEDFIQSLSQYPTKFETKDVLTPSEIFYPNPVPYSQPKTTTNAQGQRVWIGKYL